MELAALEQILTLGAGAAVGIIGMYFSHKQQMALIEKVMERLSRLEDKLDSHIEAD